MLDCRVLVWERGLWRTGRSMGPESLRRRDWLSRRTSLRVRFRLWGCCFHSGLMSEASRCWCWASQLGLSDLLSLPLGCRLLDSV